MDARPVSPENPCALRGFAFAIFASPDPERLHQLFLAFGFSRTQRHASLAIDLYEQGQISLLLDRGTAGFSAQFAAAHGPCISAMGWRADHAEQAAATAVGRGAPAGEGDLFRRDGSRLPSVRGIGDSLIYFVDDKDSWSALGFVPHPTPDHVPSKTPGFTASRPRAVRVAAAEFWVAPREADFFAIAIECDSLRGII